jgi:Fe-S-cluster containining protein
MRNCNGCTACCSGLLQGNVRGKFFGNGNACHYLTNDDICSIYRDRPSVCRNFYCAWAQELLPDHLSPKETGILTSVETDGSGKQYLKVVTKSQVSNEYIEAINTFCDTNNTYYVIARVIPICQQVSNS